MEAGVLNVAMRKMVAALCGFGSSLFTNLEGLRSSATWTLRDVRVVARLLRWPFLEEMLVADCSAMPWRRNIVGV